MDDDRGDMVGQAERLQAPRQLGAGELSLDERGEDIAGEAALGVAGHAAAQQLERDDRHRLMQGEAVEVGQRAASP